MRTLELAPGRALDMLVLGAHADDIEIGAGGTILRLLDEHPGSRVRWVVASATAERAAEARASAAAFAAAAASLDVIVGDLPDGRFPAATSAVKDLLEPLKAAPVDLIVAPHTGDAHQDHRTLAETVWQTFRDHLVVGYEIAKYDGDLGRPNLYVSLDPAIVDRKVTLLDRHFPSQHDRTWWDHEAFTAILRLRGIEAQVRYAEAFHAPKVVL